MRMKNNHTNKEKELYGCEVCINCFYNQDECICCNTLGFPCQLNLATYVDYGLQEHIRILNYKNYETYSCCEGHGECGDIYITFTVDFSFGEELPMPIGFDYKKDDYTIIASFEDSEQKNMLLNNLLDWCNSLRVLQGSKMQMFYQNRDDSIFN